MATQTITATLSTSPSVAIPYTDSIPVASQDSATSSILHTASNCLISYAHNEGIYTPKPSIEMSFEARRIFDPSFPPPHALAAFERCLHDGISKGDAKIWIGFHESHTKPLIEHANIRWVAPVPAEQLDEYLDSVFDQVNLGVYPAKARSYLTRRPFGLSNPHDCVWAAHARLQQGRFDRRDPDLVEKDQEFVQAFSADSGYCGEGVGEQDNHVKRFKVRRLSFVRQLAQIRKQRR